MICATRFVGAPDHAAKGQTGRAGAFRRTLAGPIALGTSSAGKA